MGLWDVELAARGRLDLVVADAVGGEEVVLVDDAVRQVPVGVHVTHGGEVDGCLVADGVVLQRHLKEQRLVAAKTKSQQC